MRYKFLRFPGGKVKAATFSYDDGVKQDVRFAETLTKYGLKATFNFNSFTMRGDSGISVEDAKNVILGNGHEIAVHGYNHKASGSIRPIEGIREVIDNRIELENVFGRIITGMAYPDCGITRFANDASYQSIKNYLTECDISYCRTLAGDNNGFEMPTDWHAWMPTAHHNNPKMLEWIDEFVNIDFSTMYSSSRRPRLMYIWGHSYEFDRNDNWEHLEEICKRLPGHEDIWYATNMEIYEYVTAYNSLIFSADLTMVKNPTLFDIWMDVDSNVVCIKSGETVKLQ